MCVQFLLNYQECEETAELFHAVQKRYAETPVLAEIRTGDIYPSHIIPVYCADQGTLQADLMQWGYPKFQGKGLIFNARSETAAEKTLFKGSVVHKRCVVPANGFYEWYAPEPGTKKQKYWFSAPEQPVLYMAGLYRGCHWAKDGLPLQRFVVLTTRANQSVAPYHARMPLLLERDALPLWLNDAYFAMHILQSEPLNIILCPEPQE